MGHTDGARYRFLAGCPAPVQVNFIGYPGTIGADFVDYILVDPFIVPSEQQQFFSEKLVHLPDCYLANDPKRTISERTPSRVECGLPEQGFVFCCFNNYVKLTPMIFDIWTRLLQKVPGSVLWMSKSREEVEQNLRREAEARGVDPVRLIFAPRVSIADHLARHRVAFPNSSAEILKSTRRWRCGSQPTPSSCGSCERERSATGLPHRYSTSIATAAISRPLSRP
jgi:predicted O-linked N-acetylglucosamine transferase (SPINDLY family)